MNENRGYFGIGIYRPKIGTNVGTLWRSAKIYGAAFLFTIGHRYHTQPTDTLKTPRHLPLWHFDDDAAFHAHLPDGAELIAVEMCDGACALPDFQHPQRAIYVLGAEDDGLPASLLQTTRTITIPSRQPYSLNVAVAGTLVMYDRYLKTMHM